MSRRIKLPDPDQDWTHEGKPIGGPPRFIYKDPDAPPTAEYVAWIKQRCVELEKSPADELRLLKLAGWEPPKPKPAPKVVQLALPAPSLRPCRGCSELFEPRKGYKTLCKTCRAQALGHGPGRAANVITTDRDQTPTPLR